MRTLPWNTALNMAIAHDTSMTGTVGSHDRADQDDLSTGTREEQVPVERRIEVARIADLPARSHLDDCGPKIRYTAEVGTPARRPREVADA